MTIELEEFETETASGAIWRGRFAEEPSRVLVVSLEGVTPVDADQLEANLHRTKIAMSTFSDEPLVVAFNEIVREADRILLVSKLTSYPTIDHAALTTTMIREVVVRLLDVYQLMHERGVYVGVLTPKDIRIDSSHSRINALEVEALGVSAALIQANMYARINRIWRAWLPVGITHCSAESDLRALGHLLMSLLVPLAKSDEVEQLRIVALQASESRFRDVFAMRTAILPDARPRTRTPRMDTTSAKVITADIEPITHAIQGAPAFDPDIVALNHEVEIVSTEQMSSAFNDWDEDYDSIDILDDSQGPSPVREPLVYVEKPTTVLSTMPKQIGHLEIIEEIGAGAFSTVYKARHDLLDRFVAVKTLTPRAGTPDDDVQRMRTRLLREARLAGKLTGGYSVPVYDAGFHEDFPYVVMEYVPGPTLHEYLREFGALSERQACRFAVPILKGLVEAHHHGVIHRDIKPANLMVTRDFMGNHTIRIIDYGIAVEQSRVMSALSPTRVGEFVGSPQYAAPEQFVGESSAQSDLYSLGCTLYEIVTRRRLCPSREFSQCVAAHTSPDPWKIDAESDGFGDILGRALAKSRSDRYANALEMLDDIQAWLVDPSVRFLAVEPL